MKSLHLQILLLRAGVNIHDYFFEKVPIISGEMDLVRHYLCQQEDWGLPFFIEYHSCSNHLFSLEQENVTVVLN